MKKKMIVAALLAASLATTLSAFGGHKHSEGGVRLMMETLHDMELTQAQYEKLRDMRKAKREEFKMRKADFKPLDLTEYMSSNGLDRTAYAAVMKEKASQRIAKRADAIEEILNVLTPAQRTELIEKMREAD